MKTISGALGGLVHILEFEVDTEECGIYYPVLWGINPRQHLKDMTRSYEDYVYVNIGNLPLVGKPGHPKLPMKTFIVKLPLGSEVTGVSVRDGKYIPDKEIYTLGTYFPGKLLTFETGRDNHYTYCFVRFFPLQYIPAEGRAVLITNAIIDVWYCRGAFPSPTIPSVPVFAKPLLPPYVGPERSVIIYPEEFQAQAESLKSFHESELGISTEIVTT